MVDLSVALSDFNRSVNEAVEKAKMYFSSLSMLGMIAWGLICLGFLLCIAGIVLL